MRSLCQQTAGFSDAPQRVLLTLCGRSTRLDCWQKDFFSELGLLGFCQHRQQFGRDGFGLGVDGADLVLCGMGVGNVGACWHPAATVEVSASSAQVDFHVGLFFFVRWDVA